MTLKQFFKRELSALSMTGKERAFVITLVIMLSMLVGFIIIKVRNTPEEIWLEIPPAEEVAKLLEEEKKIENTEEPPITNNSPVTTQAYNQADKRIQHTEALKSLEELLAEQKAQQAQTSEAPPIEEGIGASKAKVEPYKVNDGMSFKELEKYKPLASDQKRANKRTLISYYLSDREAIAELPNPIYTCEESGKVVINITVDGQGYVTEASYNKSASSTTNGCLIDNAIHYARKARFDRSNKNKQVGTITYLFQ